MKKFMLGAVVCLMALVSGACATPTATETAPTIDVGNLPATLSVREAEPLLDNPGVFWLDVREQSEYDAGHIPGIALIPSGELANRLSEVPKDRPVIVTCRSGSRSAAATKFLREQGYTNVHNMEGGIVAWEQAGYPVEK